MKPFDVDALLERLDEWCSAQEEVKARLVKAPPMTDAEIDRIPMLLESFPYELPTPYHPSHFVIPDGYRALLRRCGGVHIETWLDDDDTPEIWEVFHVFRPGDCSRAHHDGPPTLCDSWTVAATVHEREFTTTDFVSFASMGFDVEASRWCFYIGEGGVPSIYDESNDYECLLGKYVDTGEWISEGCEPVFPTFEAWLTTLVDVITARPLLDREANDDLLNEVVQRGQLL